MSIKKKEEVIRAIPANTVNKGFTQVSDCITMCYDLTTDEKTLYTFILKNYNDEVGYSFPSWEYIKFVLNRGDGKTNETLKGLQEKGLIRRRKTRGKNNRYYLNPLNEVPCIALSEATFQFIKKANELDLNVWDVVKGVIKSENYRYFKDNFIPHKKDQVDISNFLRNNEENVMCTTDEYLLYLQQSVIDKMDEVVPVPVYVEKNTKSGRILPF
ncbi:helix-turn-helix domain-containing protein [Cytobacillus firmus]|nr:helix-turn-helix domain-containing protein [Cytobacillus firmus]